MAWGPSSLLRARLLHHRDRGGPVLVTLQVRLHLVGRQAVAGGDELLQAVVTHPEAHLERREAGRVRGVDLRAGLDERAHELAIATLARRLGDGGVAVGI